MSKWRSQNVRLQPGNVDTIYFERNPELPNSLYVTNRSDGRLYIGVDKVPSENYYDLLLEPMESNIVCRPFAIGRIMVLNTSNDFADIMVYSDSVDFDFSLLKSKIEVSISDVKQGTVFDVMHSALNSLDECIDNGRLLIKPMLGSVICGDTSVNGYLSISSSLTPYEEINFITNDGTNDAKICINSNDNFIILKPGESINNLVVNGTSLYVTGIDGSAVNCRFIIRMKEVI